MTSGITRGLALVAAGVAALLVFLADWGTGAEISLSFFYLLPVVIAAWWGGLPAALTFVAISLCGWVGAYFLTGEVYSGRQVLLWNAAVEAAILFAMALTMNALRAAFTRERTLRSRLEGAYRRIDAEMHAVGALQMRMLPAAVPEVTGLALAVHYTPSLRAGGDYYDFIALPDGALAVFLGDASGHGSPAAVLMAMTRVLLRTTVIGFEHPEAVLGWIHDSLRQTAPSGTFVTACLLVLNPARDSMVYAIAGHDPPLVRRAATGAIEPLENPTGLPLAYPGDARLSACTTRLAPGDSIVLFTDGLSESAAPDGRFFGSDGVRATLRAVADASAAHTVDALWRTRCAHAGRESLDDDLTVLAVRVKPGA